MYETDDTRTILNFCQQSATCLHVHLENTFTLCLSGFARFFLTRDCDSKLQVTVGDIILVIVSVLLL